jgi:hypothetical protein
MIKAFQIKIYGRLRCVQHGAQTVLELIYGDVHSFLPVRGGLCNHDNHFVVHYVIPNLRPLTSKKWPGLLATFASDFMPAAVIEQQRVFTGQLC